MSTTVAAAAAAATAAAAADGASASPSGPPRLAEIACQLCRRRKVKCDRTLPHCEVCIQTNQVCEYPLRPRKPGPKIGSLQRHKRRYRDREGSAAGAQAAGSTPHPSKSSANGAVRRNNTSQSPAASSCSDVESMRDAGAGVYGANGTASAPSRARGNRRGTRGEPFESVFDSVFEDDDYDEKEDAEDRDRRRRRQATARRRETAPSYSTSTTAAADADRSMPAHGRTSSTSPAGTTSDEWTQRRRNSRLNINDLSFILHPSHEASTPKKDGETGAPSAEAGPQEQASDNSHPREQAPSAATPPGARPGLFQQACAALGVSEAMLRACIQGYFANMVAINLFHQPSFADKLGAVTSPVQLFALLTAMMGYAVRFQGPHLQAAAHSMPEQPQPPQSQPPPPPPLQAATTAESPMDVLDQQHFDPMLMAMDSSPMPQMQLMPPPASTPAPAATTAAASVSTPAPAATPPAAAASSQAPAPPNTPLPPPEHFLDMSKRLIERALDQCGDDPPTLIILQACIIYTHCELTRGVHGRAYRSLGMCVRLAYEMNLHLVDAKISPAAVSGTAWRDAEEKRRAWWAIWEMDVFACTIRRTPTAIDWTQMETLLPVDDADWFAAPGRETANGRRSCFMELDPVCRWKALQASGNHSPKAWFLVVNSFMKDARVISSPRGVPLRPEDTADREAAAAHPGSSSSLSGKRRAGAPGTPYHVQEARQKLEILGNCMQCFLLALPAHLQYRNQYLAFGTESDATVSTVNPSSTDEMALAPSQRQLHCGIYNIFVMTQLTRLMIHRYELFGSHAQHLRAAKPQGLGWSSPLDDPAVLQYFEAADNILTIVNRSCEEHIRHINPFLLSTLWLAAAVQLVRQHVAVPRLRTTSGVGPAHQQTLIKSRFDVLYLTYKRCAAFWNARTAMERNLETLETQLEGGRGDREHEEEEGEYEEHGEKEALGVHDERRAGPDGGRDDGESQGEKRDRDPPRPSGGGGDSEHQRKRKKTRVVKEKPARVSEIAVHTGRLADSSSTDADRYASWSPAVSHAQPPPVPTTALPQQVPLMAHPANLPSQPNFQLQTPPTPPTPPTPSTTAPPLSTYSDPTGTSSAGFLAGGEMIHVSTANGPTTSVAAPAGAPIGSPTVSFLLEPNGEGVGTPGRQQQQQQRRATNASLNYFKFDSPYPHQQSRAHAGGFEAPDTAQAQAQAQALLTFMQLSAGQQNGGHHPSGGHHPGGPGSGEG